MSYKTDWCFEFENQIGQKKAESIRRVNEFAQKWSKNKEYLKSPEALKEAFDEVEEIFSLGLDNSWENNYYYLKMVTKSDDAEIRAKLNQAENLTIELNNLMKFFFLDLGKIEQEKREIFLRSPLLKDYKHFLKKRFDNAKYDLSEKEEKILSLTNTGSYSMWVEGFMRVLSKAEKKIEDLDGNLITKNFSELQDLVSDSSQDLRERATRAFNEILVENSDFAESEINAILQLRKINDQIRGFDRPDKKRHLEDDIESEVVDILIETVNENFDVSKRYYELKSKLFGFKKLKYSERNISFGKVKSDYNFEEAVKIIRKVFGDLDSSFLEIFNNMLNDGRIDVFPKKGKISGAFCYYGESKFFPIYVLLNFNGKLREIETLAHEMGHAIHGKFKKENQNSLNRESLKSIAEVPSIFMEDFVFEELKKYANKEEQLALMMEKLNDDISTIFRQTAFYNFELELHANFRKRGYLSLEEIGQIFKAHLKIYLGDFVEFDEGSQNWWMYIVHFRYYFYVYSYVSGLLISKSMQRSYKENKEFIEKFKKVLAAGSSKSPKEIFMDIGIDITKKDFWKRGIDEVKILLDQTETLAKELGKI